MPEINPILFSFAIIADTHIMPEDRLDTSPYAVQNKANQRARRVVKDLITHDPKFVVHLGDMVRPFPALPDYDNVCELALRIFQDILCPVYYLPGNHDIGDKPTPSAPAPIVSDEFVDKYNTHFGPTFNAFDHEGIHFVTLNASVINSGLREETDQWMWLEKFARKNAGERCFFFIHYPPYLAVRDELPHYDNIDEPGRTRLLDIVSRLSVEGLFAGHVHHFFYNRDGQTDMYCLPSTAFTRHDFSELFAIAPAVEFGRDDFEKLGYAMVDVFADGHAVRQVNADQEISHIPIGAPRIKPLHPREGHVPPVAVQLRHDWSVVTALPTNGPLSDFSRKKARNDYPILATWQIGLTWLRVPVEDIIAPVSRERMRALKAMGQRFICMIFGSPSDQVLKSCIAHSGLIDALEIVLTSDEAEFSASIITRLRNQLDKPVYFGTLESSAQTAGAKTKYFAHKTGFGFRSNETAHVNQLLSEKNPAVHSADGLLFQISTDQDVLTQIKAIDALGHKLNKSVMVHVPAAGQSPAQAQFDALLLANRTALACLGAFLLHKGMVVLDTLVDIDRGAYPRSGLIDRRGNMNLSGRYLKTMLAFLVRNSTQSRPVIDDISETEDQTRVRFSLDARQYWLCLSHTNDGHGFEGIEQDLGPFRDCLDLRSGTSIGPDCIGAAYTGLLVTL